MPCHPILTTAAAAALDVLQRPVWVFDPVCQRHVHANPAALRLWGAATLQAFMEQDSSGTAQAMRTGTELALADGAVLQERVTFCPLGVPITVETVTSGVRLLNGNLGMLMEGRVLDVLAAEVMALEAVRHTCALVSWYDATGAVTFRNPSATAVYAGTRSAGAGTFAASFDDPAEAAAAWQQAWDGVPALVEARVWTAAGLRWHRISLRRVPDPATGAPSILVNEQDVSVSVQARLQVEHLAMHDALTDLPNRTLFRRRMEDAAQSGTPFAVLMVDLDRFKAVNDTHGHGAGDAVLQAVAARLRGSIRRTDTLARLGGDEFGVLLPGLDAAAASRMAAALIARVQEECDVGGFAVQVGASVGIALHGGSGAALALDDLVRAADRALYGAKSAGRNTVCVSA